MLDYYKRECYIVKRTNSILIILLGMFFVFGCQKDNEQLDEVTFENRYEDCTIETCSQDMLYERWQEVKRTKDDYFGESVDIEEVLIELYGISVADIERMNRVQEDIVSWEEMLEEGNRFAVEGYTKSVIDLGEEGTSKYLTYDEAKSLAESGGYYEWWQENKERVVKSEKEVQWKAEPKKESIAVGFTYENFLLIGDDDRADELDEINFMLGGEGVLQSQSSNTKTYCWERGVGKASYMVITVTFVDGIATYKAQAGLLTY